jgi:GDP-L-fucose synthase
MKVFIAGQEGMVGNAIYKLLKKKGFDLINCKRSILDLTSQYSVERFFKIKRPQIVINAAGKVGGILDNSKFQSDYLYINSIIGLNLIHSSFKYNVKKLINLGSACIYPKSAKTPIKEDSLLTSQLEKTNEGYALAKILTLKYCSFLNKKFTKNFISLQPVNLYGERDNFDLNSSHVIPALVRKFHEAKVNNKKKVVVWGDGSPEREFLHVDDLANAVYFCLKKKIKHSYLNVGGNDCITISQLSKIIKKITKFKGKIIFDKSYPNGVKKRNLDNSRIYKLGWRPKINLEKGLKNYYNYFIKLYDN